MQLQVASFFFRLDSEDCATVDMRTNEILYLGEMLNAECNAYKYKAGQTVANRVHVVTHCLDCACAVSANQLGCHSAANTISSMVGMRRSTSARAHALTSHTKIMWLRSTVAIQKQRNSRGRARTSSLVSVLTLAEALTA